LVFPGLCNTVELRAPPMTIFKASVAALALVATGAGGVSARDVAPALTVEKNIGKVAVDGVEMSFVMGEAYDPDNK
jgi:hypothetical protein